MENPMVPGIIAMVKRRGERDAGPLVPHSGDCACRCRLVRQDEGIGELSRAWETLRFRILANAPTRTVVVARQGPRRRAGRWAA